MYKVDINNKKLIELSPTKYADLGLKERFDIQEWIEKSPTILGEDLLVVEVASLPRQRCGSANSCAARSASQQANATDNSFGLAPDP